jgi:hypothetical protein
LARQSEVAFPSTAVIADATVMSAWCQSRHPVVTPHRAKASADDRVRRAGDWIDLICKEIEEKFFNQKTPN